MLPPEVRRLRLAYIDDKPAAIPAPEIDVVYLKGLGDVQKQMVGGKSPTADLVLCDVNMAHREKDHPEGVVWGIDGALPAYGPILALPFLSGGGVCEFVPISSWWAQVEDDGYVLVPVALLLSAVSRRQFGLRDARDWIREQMSPTEWLRQGKAPDQSPTARARGSTDPLTAIAGGLRGLRAKLTKACEESQLTIAGLDSTIQYLRVWDGGPLIESDDGPCRVELLYPDRSDTVRVTSLFADVMSFREIPTPEEVARIIAELESWMARDPCFCSPRSTGLYELAARLLTNRLPTEADKKKGSLKGSNGLKDRAKAAAKASGIDPALLVRTAIIFAFLRGWYFAEVQKTICDPEEGAYGVMDWAYWFLDIHPRRSPYNPFKRLLGTEADDRIEIGSGRYQSPFDVSAKTVFEAYAALRKNKALSLTPAEKALGRRFIVDSKRFFPADLEAESRLLWEPHLDDEMIPYPAWLT